MRVATLSASLIVLFMFSGCDNPRESARGFKLPAGDVEAGQAAYAALHCNGCHGIVGEGAADAPTGTKTLMLGGPTTKLPSDGYLVTAIINPSHFIKKQGGMPTTLPSGQSLMSDFNDSLSVTQMIDLVEYLQTLHEFRTVYQGHGMP